MSLVNAVPRLGRLLATVAVGTAGVALAAFPDFVTQAEDWLTHLGNVATPLAGVIVADYAIVKRSALDVPALFEPQGRYRYVRGVNPAAIAAVAIGVVVYYLLPDAYVKAAWGTAVGALVYLALARLEALLWPSLRQALAPA
jgi:cytosine/uracil/thiamine/allantoin permease